MISELQKAKGQLVGRGVPAADLLKFHNELFIFIFDDFSDCSRARTCPKTSVPAGISGNASMMCAGN
jgi:hypothetical protein